MSNVLLDRLLESLKPTPLISRKHQHILDSFKCDSPTGRGNHYSAYQLFLYQTISEQREKGMTFDTIAGWLNKEGYLTVRGKKFRGAHVHSILKKRLAKEELLKREYPEVWSHFSMEVVDKTILMSDFGFSN